MKYDSYYNIIENSTIDNWQSKIAALDTILFAPFVALKSLGQQR